MATAIAVLKLESSDQFQALTTNGNVSVYTGVHAVRFDCGKTGALSILARLVAAVEALPDDVHPEQGTILGGAA